MNRIHKIARLKHSLEFGYTSCNNKEVPGNNYYVEHNIPKPAGAKQLVIQIG